MSSPDPSVELAAMVVRRLGGRYSAELGIDVDAGDEEIERWFVAATLFGTRISAQIAGRTFDELAKGGVQRIADAARHLGLLPAGSKGELARISRLAPLAGCDERDLESGLVRLALAHRRMADCPGRRACFVLAAEDADRGG